MGITDQGTGSNAYDLAGNVTSKAGLALGYASNSNALCNTTASAACTRKTAANAVAGDVVYDGNGNIQSYTRPLTASTPGADGALLNLFEYSSFNMPRLITKSLNGAVVTSGEFFYDAGYQRVRQIKRTGATTFGTGNIADDVLYVVPGGFEVHRNSAGQVTSSIATISGSDGVAATVSTVFDVNTGLPVAQNNIATGNVSTAQSGTDTVTKLILKDHLGSMVAEITLAGTAASPSVNIATLVIHGFGPWGNARGANPFAEGQRGFTGHEHLAELGIIHMNGRLYDPVLGRFLQADPIIQAPHNAQSHNRYSYVLNNPLSFTDPSGFSAWTRFRAPILAIAAAVTMQYYLMPYLLAGAVASGAITAGTANFIGVVASGFASGGISGGNIQSALQGAFTAGLTFGLASEFGLHGGADFMSGKHLGQIALHAAMGCGSSAAAGGSCKSGAISGGVSAFASPMLPGDGKSFSAGRLVGSAIIGAVASRLSGGKAENGALTAAFSYLFNEASAEARARFATAGGIAGGLVGAGVAAGCTAATGVCAAGAPGLVLGGSAVGAIAGDRIAVALGQLDDLITKAAAATMGPLETQYALVTQSSGLYPDVRNGVRFMNAGEVWKYGTTADPEGRYPRAAMDTLGLQMVEQTMGNRYQVLAQEKIMLIGHALATGDLPPSNRIFK